MDASYPRLHHAPRRSRRARPAVFAANPKRAARRRRRSSELAGPPASIAATDRSSDDQKLESTVDQALAVERHGLRIHHFGQPRVLHDFGVDAIAMRARLVHDPREHHGFAALELHAPRERCELSDLDVVADPLLVVESAILPPHFSCLLGHAPIRRQVFQRYRYHKAVNVAHNVSKFVEYLRKTVRAMRIRRLLFSNGLHIGKAGLEFLADHLVHADEYANDFRNVGTGAVHAPGDIRGVPFGLEGKFSRVVALDRLDEIQLDRDLRWWR